MTISTINGNTLLHKLGIGLAGGVGILVILGGCQGIRYLSTNASRSNKIKQIENAINLSDLNLASKLVSEAEKGKDLAPSYITNFRDRIENGKSVQATLAEQKAGIARLEDALGQYDPSKASTILVELTKSGRYTGAQLKDLERKIAEYEEEGFYEKIVRSKNEEKENAARNYLRIYPSGQKRKEVILEQLDAQYISLYEDMKNLSRFATTLTKLKGLNLDLERFSKEGISLSDKFPLNAITDQRTNYLQYATNSTNKFEINSKITVIGKSDRSWNSQYMTERDNNIKAGAKGEVVELERNGEVIIKFHQVKGQWQTDWYNKAKDLTKRNGAFVAWYRPGEIISDDPLTDIQKYQFEKEMQKLEANLKLYK